MRHAILAIAALGLLAATPAPRVDIREWPVPWEDTRPRDPAVDSTGRVWFVGQTGNYLGWLDPKSGTFGRFDLPRGTAPHNVIVRNGRELWIAGNGDAFIGRVDASNGAVKRYPMPDAKAGDPHTLAVAPDGSIWFTVQSGGFVGHLDPRSGNVRLTEMPARGRRPYGIVVDASGKPWFNEFGSNFIGTIDPKTMALREYPLPTGARSRRIALSGGGIWYVDYARGFLGRLDPASGRVEEWQTPAGKSSLPYAMASDERGRLWLVETGPQPNRLVGFDPATRTFFAGADVPSGGSTVRHMIFHPSSREIWFGTDTNTIGRAKVPK
jgi:virginiamycin B lyase